MTGAAAVPESRPTFVSATRQKADVLFSSDEPIGGSDTFSSAAAEVRGHSVVTFLAISDRPFRIRVEEACSGDGPWALTATLPSAFDTVSQLERACARVAPCGSFMRAFLDNLSAAPQRVLRFCSLGLPEGDIP